MKPVRDAEPVAPFTRSQPNEGVLDRRPGLTERRVTVTNPDGSTTTHRFWTDARIN
jgi:hypothetical protein